MRTLPPSAPNDRIIFGVGIAVCCQLVFIMGSGFGFFLIPNSFYAFVSWGLWQWIVLIPLYFMNRSKGRQLAATGILIAGCIGFLLNAGCDLLILPMRIL